MSCNEYIIWISGHIDGINPKKEEQQLQAHLAGCPHCRKVLADMKANEAVMKEETLTPPLQISRRVMAAVRKDAAAQKRARFRSYGISVAAVAAVLCLVLISAFRVPERTDEGPLMRMRNTPTDVVMPIAERDEEPMVSYSEEEQTAFTSPRTEVPCHCVFVELSSRDEMPREYVGVTTEEFLSRVTREARDNYFYGGSMIYGVIELGSEELSQWESRIQSRFPQEFEETDRYMVVFCSESR